MYRRIIKILFISALFIILPQIAQAGFLDELGYCTEAGDCNLSDMALGFSALIRWLLGAMGAVALVLFVWGGIQWLISGGNAERVNRGKDIMMNTVFAIFLAFGSYLIVTFFVNDVLNATESDPNYDINFRLEEGYSPTCGGENTAGKSCGPNRECSGEVTGLHPEMSQKCLYICQIETLDKINIGECVAEVTNEILEAQGLIKYDGSGLCPSPQICVYKK